YSLRSRCLDITHTLLDTSAKTAAASLDMARIHGGATDDIEQPPPCYEIQSTGETGVLEPGEYRFAFEFAVPSEDLPPSVASAMGRVTYRLGACMRRQGWLSSAIVAVPVDINIVQAPSTYLASPCMRATAFGLFLGDSVPSLNALTTLPLVLGMQVSESWKVSVFMVSRAMKLGMESKIQAFVTRANKSGCSAQEPHGLVHVVGISAQLTEVITHKVPGTPCQVRSRNVVAKANASVISALAAKPARELRMSEQLLDAQTIDCLGESLNGLVLPASAALGLTPQPSRIDICGQSIGGVQPSSCSEVFSVSHDLDVVVDVRGVEMGKVCRVTLSTPVVVLPEVLLHNTAASSLPSYADVSKDLVLASSLADCFCASSNDLCPQPPPTYV
ncbi:hypothetical protein J3B02_005584, partial [Coemansia erecta]